MSKKALISVLIILVLIVLVLFLINTERKLNTENPAAVIYSEADKQQMINEITAEIDSYKKLVSDLQAQIDQILATPAPAPDPVVSPSEPTITLTPSEGSMQVGRTMQLSAVYKDAGGNVMPKSFSWSTSNSSIARVSSTGLVTARSTPGTAVITATSGTVRGTAAITVVSSGADTTLPSVSITSPLNGATISGNFTLSISATDNIGVTKVEIYSNGQLKGTLTTAPYTVPVDSRLTSDGTYSLTAKAYDAAGNSRTSSAVNITIKNTFSTTPGSAKFAVGDRVKVQTSTYLNVRSSASIRGTILGRQLNGAQGAIVEGPTSSGGYQWWKVNYDSGVDGWSVENNLVKYAAAALTCPTSVPSNTFRACYYDNMDFTGLKVSQQDSTINFDWANGSPDASIGADTFSAVWEGNFAFESGTYNFSATSDDGIRVYVDGNKIVDIWSDHSAFTRTVSQTLTAGTHRVKMEYYENAGQAVAKLSWAKQADAGGSTSSASGSAGGNEPAGMTFLVQRGFNCVADRCENGNWIASGESNMSIVSDSSAPKSPGNVLQMTYQTSLTGGTGPANQEYNWTGKRQLYLSSYIKYSPNFQSHSTSVNKEIHFWVGGGNKIFSMAYGSGSPDGPLRPAFGLQGIAAAYNNGSKTATTLNLMPNVDTSVQIKRGEWQHHEILLTGNTSGNADGRAEMWIDGKKALDYQGIMFASGDGLFSTIKWNPTWGGLGDQIVSPFYMQMDDIYMSVK